VIRLLIENVADRLVVVALRDPYELRNLADVRTYVCAFSFRPCAAEALAEVLFGEAEPFGVSPVSVPRTVP
jgi:beta-N-acetylhexosaminidase